MSTRLRVREPAALACLLALALSTVFGGTAATSAAAIEPAITRPAAAAATTTFDDEFNKPAGTPADTGKWQLHTGDNVNNREREYYTTSTRNAAQDGKGHLVITARKENPANYQCWYGTCQYTSARLNTAGEFTQAYGHFEARMKLPRGQGMWPAFWMLGNNIGSAGWPMSGEIDIMENVGFEPGTVHGTIHGPGYSGANGIGSAYTLPGGQRFADGFHTFAVDWAPNKVTWSVDGVAYETRTPADVGGNEWVFDHPFYLILNLAVGGYWPGDPNASTVFPQQLLVDYVRVTAGNDANSLTGRITGVAGNSTNGTAARLGDNSGATHQNWSAP
ncbi:MAG: glycoside hydrolase family 16 protein [Sciscionella sp.]